jgi:hypothetical protein
MATKSLRGNQVMRDLKSKKGFFTISQLQKNVTNFFSVLLTKIRFLEPMHPPLRLVPVPVRAQRVLSNNEIGTRK